MKKLLFLICGLLFATAAFGQSVFGIGGVRGLKWDGFGLRFQSPADSVIFEIPVSFESTISITTLIGTSFKVFDSDQDSIIAKPSGFALTNSSAVGIYVFQVKDGEGSLNAFSVDSLGNAIMAGDVAPGDDVLLADGAVVGITGNEVITFLAAGSISITGANFGVGGTPGTLAQFQGADAYLTLQNTTAENGQDGAETRIIGEDHANNALAQIQFHHENAADDFKGGMRLSTNTGSGLTGAVWIDEFQNVGVGSAPQSKLHIFESSSNTDLTSLTFADLAFIFKNTDATESNLSLISFQNSDGAGSVIIGTVYGTRDGDLGEFIILTNTTGGARGERFRVTHAGNIDIGGTVIDEMRPSFSILGDADSDGTTTSETFTIDLTAAADPTAAYWLATSTQAEGLNFDMNGEIADRSDLASESLADIADFEQATWAFTGEAAAAATNAVYTFSASGVGTITQTSGGDMAIDGVANSWYRFDYTVSSSTVAGETVTITTAFALTAETVAVGTDGAFTIYFKSAASPANFVLDITGASSGNFTIEDVSLKRIDGGDLSVYGNILAYNPVTITAVGNPATLLTLKNADDADLATFIMEGDGDFVIETTRGMKFTGGTDIQINGASGVFVNNLLADADFFVRTDNEDSALVVDGTDGDIYMEGLGTGVGTFLVRVSGTDEIVELNGAATLPTTVTFTPNAASNSGTSVADDAAISVTNYIMRMVGADADALLDTDPAVNDGVADGQIVIIQGTADGNTVTIADNVNTQLAGGLSMTLGDGDVLCLMWDSNFSMWIEQYRSDN